MYDQHSSEEELEVINGPQAASPVPDIEYNNKNSSAGSGGSGGSGGTDTDVSPKRCCSSTLLERRKRSLAHNSDDEVSYYTWEDYWLTLNSMSDDLTILRWLNVANWLLPVIVVVPLPRYLMLYKMA